MDSLLNDYLNSAQLSASLIIPVLVVIVSAVLVFLCGFRKPTEPHFRKIAASVESSTKKTKKKEKPQPNSSAKSTSQNGAMKTAQPPGSTGEAKKQPAAAIKKEVQVKQQVSTKRKEAVTQKKSPTNEKSTHSNKKAEKAPKAEKVKKPADFDDGGWTTVQSRTDKKKKQEDLLLSNALTAAISQSGKKTSDATKGDAKLTKNPKQLKDQVNKSKKEAADNKNKKNSAAVTTNNEEVDKVTDTIENLVNELKKKDGGNLNLSTSNRKQQKVDPSADHIIAEEKSDDSKPVPESGVVFNEMEDTWTEAKAPKKGKKKARKD